MATAECVEYVTTGQVAKETGQPIWLVRELADRLQLVKARAGGYRLILAEDVPAIIEAMRQWKKRTPVGVASDEG